MEHGNCIRHDIVNTLGNAIERFFYSPVIDVAGRSVKSAAKCFEKKKRALKTFGLNSDCNGGR